MCLLSLLLLLMPLILHVGLPLVPVLPVVLSVVLLLAPAVALVLALVLLKPLFVLLQHR